VRILVVGAGGIGGYFGGRLLQAGCDVTFLLRPRRVAQIGKTGLVIKSPLGGVTLPAPPHVVREQVRTPFDLVVIACKAYDLDETMESFARAVGPQTAILPLLNGMRHLDRLAARFGEGRVLGGHCLISVALDTAGTVVHFSDLHVLTFGELKAGLSARVAAIEAQLSRAAFETRASREVLHEMWEKWVFIAALGCINSLMRAAVGDIVAAGATDLALGLYDECSGIGRLNGFAPREPAIAHAKSILTAPGSTITASLLKDVEAGRPTEAEHIVGDLIDRGRGTVQGRSLLRVAYTHLRARDIRRAREHPRPDGAA
jgi:2-dehydropantoate 2-reductase